MKITEKGLCLEILGANRASKHMLLGLQLQQAGGKYRVQIIWRKNGALYASVEGTPKEALAAITMFRYLAEHTQPEGDTL